MSSFPVQLPLDNGFLRRECPHCLGQFKWHYGPHPERPDREVDPLVYYCPLCGESAPTDQWWTAEQLDYAQKAAAGPAMREVSAEIGKMFRGIKGMTYKPGALNEPEPPYALSEPNDMIAVAPPCHPWEPLKIPELSLNCAHCLICGAQFAS